MADASATTDLPPSPDGPLVHDPLAHDAFISYSRKDTAFADRLEKALDRYTPPAGLGRERRRLRVFRDQHDFAGTDYFAAIQKHLAGARKLIVLCSPDAAASAYVNDEIERFVRFHGTGDLVPVLWRGLPNNEAGPGQEGERAFPPALARALEMPLAVDFRGVDPRARRIDGAHTQGAWMLLLANLLDVSRAEIEQRELQRRRRVRRVWAAGIGAVFVSLLALTVWALFEGERALARQLAAEAALPGGLDAGEVERRVLLARESVQRLARLGEPTLDADSALRDALAEAPRRRLSLPAGHRIVAFSADGNHLVGAEGRRLIVYGLVDGRPAREVPLERPLQVLVAGADHRFVAGIDKAGFVRAWSWPDLAAVASVPSQVASSAVQCLAFADGGASAVALRVTSGKTPRAELLRWRLGETTLTESASVDVPQLLQARRGMPCLVVRTHTTTAGEAVMATLERPPADGVGPAITVLRWPLQDVAWMGMTRPRTETIQVWPDVLMGELDQNTDPVLLLPDGRLQRAAGLGTRTVDVVPKWSSAQALAPGGAWLVAAAALEDPYVPLLKSTRFDIVDTANGAVMQSVGDHAGVAVFAPDGATLLTMAGARLRLWDRRDGRERLRLFAAAPVDQVLFDPSSRQLAAVAADGRLEVFDIGAPDEVLRAAPGLLVAPLGDRSGMTVADGQHLLVTTGVGMLPKRLELDRYVYAMQASPDGRWLALVTTPEAPLIRMGDPPQAQLWLVQTGATPAVRWRGPAAQHLRFDRASRRLLAATEDGTVRLLDLSGASLAWERRLKPARALAYVESHDSRYHVALSDDGETVGIGSADGLVLLSGGDGRMLRRDAEPTGVFALSADGRLVARVGGKNRLEVLRASDGRSMRELERRGVTEVRELLFSPGATRLIAIGGTSFSTFFGGALFAEEHLMVWDLASGLPELRLPDSRIDAGDYQTNIGARADERRQLSGLVWNRHTREVAGILHPSMLAYWTVPSGMVRARLMSWRLTDSGLVETYRGGDREEIVTEAFAAGGGALLVSGTDRIRRVIDLSGPRLLLASCGVVRREWTDTERRRHLAGVWRRPLRCPSTH